MYFNSGLQNTLDIKDNDRGYSYWWGSNKDKCVHFDTNAQTLIFDNNKDVCDTGVGTKPIYKNI